MEEVEVVNRFRKPFSFLSNMAKCEVVWDGHVFLSVEAAYQYARCRDERDREKILRYQKNPALVKRVSHSMSPREDWDSLKLSVMEDLLRQKYLQPKFFERLVALRNCERIEEGNLHGDRWWGVDLETGEGLNNLGKLIMKIRDEMIQASERAA